MRTLFLPAVALMNRLKYPQKFALITLVFMLPLTIALLLLIFKIDRDINVTQKEIYGNVYLRPLRSLLEHALRERVAAQAVAAGGDTATLGQLQAQIGQDLAALEAVETQLGREFDTTDQFQTLLMSWQRIRGNGLDAAEPVNDELRKSFVTDIRALIARVGDKSSLILDPDLDSYYLMNAVLIKLPDGVEVVTQMQLLGETMIDGPLAISSDERTRLIALKELLRANSYTTQAGISVAFNNNPSGILQPSLSAPLKDTVISTNALLVALDEELLNTQNAGIDGTTFRALTEKALASKFTFWDRAVIEVDALLQERIDSFARQKYLALGTTALMVLLGVYLWTAFYLAVMQTVSSLEVAARRMVDGDLNAMITLENQDELGQVTRSFNKIATALVKASAQQQAMVDHAVDGIMLIDSQGTITSFNPAAEQIFGYRADEVVGQSIRLLIKEPYHIQYKLISIGQDIPGIRKDGSEFPMDLAAGRMMLGDQLLYIGMVRDVTRRKRQEEELQAAKEAAEAASRAKSDFLANMSHEIRTPMNAIIGMTGLLLDTSLDNEQRDFAETVRQSSDTLLTIINDILDFSKIEAGRLELEHQPFDLRECLESGLDLLATRASEKGLDLAYIVDAETPDALYGDVTRLRQILVNLLANAVKFTDHGEVVVEVSARLVDPLPDPDTRAQNEIYEIEFSVKDTGIGIPADRIGMLFRSFSQVDASTTRRYGGTGLGLAISKRLCEMMGGRMWVQSDVGVGSTFSFTIIAELAPSPRHVYLHGNQPQLTRKRLLIVDDNATNRQILAMQAQSWGMLPTAIESGAEALALIRRGEQFDVGILDMQMPEMDGLTLAAEIRRFRDHRMLPLVMLTSLGRRDADARIAEFAAFLTKPIKPSQLYDVLASIFADQPLRLREKSIRPQFDGTLGQRLPLRILLAEDNMVNQKLALLLLDRMGYRADVAANGIEVLDAVVRQSYDVVLMDVQMPEMDGLEATRAICENWPIAMRPYIVAMTANAMQGDREQCIAAGMDDYITKPVQITELQGALERAAIEVEQRAMPVVSTEIFTNTIDQAVLDELRLLENEDQPDVVSSLIDLFVAETPPLLEELRAALAAEDADRVRRTAHSIKSSSASLGARMLSALSADLEKQGRSGTLTTARTTFAELEQEFERVCQALEIEQRGTP